jgi:hypothetical protein
LRVNSFKTFPITFNDPFPIILPDSKSISPLTVNVSVIEIKESERFRNPSFFAIMCFLLSLEKNVLLPKLSVHSLPGVGSIIFPNISFPHSPLVGG